MSTPDPLAQAEAALDQAAAALAEVKTLLGQVAAPAFDPTPKSVEIDSSSFKVDRTLRVVLRY